MHPPHFSSFTNANMASTSMALTSFAAYSYTLSPTEGAATWLEGCRGHRAAEASNPNAAVVRARLEQAYSCQELHQERVHQALSSLRNKGLIVSVDKTHSPLAASIASDLLNSKDIRTPPIFTIDILSPSRDIVSIPVPSRSPLLISFLAQTLAVNIYLFSSRSLPVLFKHDDAAPSLGLFHHIDPILGVSDYLVLTPSSQITADPPSASSLSATPFVSNQTCATFRAHARRANRNGNRKGDELSEEDVVLAFKKSW